jgi:hypothetical protein
MNAMNGKVTFLAIVLGVAVLALAGVSLASNGHGKGKGDKGAGQSLTTTSPSSSQYQYSSGGNQYGRHKVAVCHKGRKTLWLPQPAVRAHLRHGDKLGVC